MGNPHVTLFLCGDVMTGRGIDQILPHPVEPQLFEPYMRSAIGYVKLAEEAAGPLPKPVDFSYVWGDALAELDRVRPDARIINLETAVTTSDDAWPRKGIHYRMHPANVPCLAAAKIDCCVLANNHALDWGIRGLEETLDTLRAAGVRTAGAGRDAAEAAAPAVIDLAEDRRVLVFAFGMESAGMPSDWAATRQRPGLRMLPDLSPKTADGIAAEIAAVRRAGDIAVVSIHWGGNWGYDVSNPEREFAHRLIGAGAADVVHGHSSHHPKAIEIHRDRPILYGCGDFLNDYEGISGHEPFRPELALMYFPTFDAASGRLVRLSLTPTRIARFRAVRATEEEGSWLAAMLEREGRRFGTRVEREAQSRLIVAGY
ncbi:MAG TPA: CapA family protein [Burkholderiales bacterium]|nr:CapA family protein [Burkholderiales bacterium]